MAMDLRGLSTTGGIGIFRRRSGMVSATIAGTDFRNLKDFGSLNGRFAAHPLRDTQSSVTILRNPGAFHRRNTTMAYWLFKEEPDHYSYDDLERDKRTVWDGVTNNLALQNLR